MADGWLLAESVRARPWGIYPLVFFGMIALAIAPPQLNRRLLARRRPLHRRLGTVYVIAAFATGLAGLYMSVYSYGGTITHLGFGLLGVGLLLSTTAAWRWILQGDIGRHREWMLRSVAFLLAAVTLRIWLPLLQVGTSDFDLAYRMVAWLCWVPNLVIVEIWIRSSRGKNTLAFLRATTSVGILLIAGLASACAGTRAEPVRANAPAAPLQAAVSDRLYFGRSIPSGGTVSEADWSRFLRDVVTPRFPDGLTAWHASGQWRDRTGNIVREESFVLELIHGGTRASETAIAEIVSQYRTRFRQDAVLRVRDKVDVQY